MLKLQASSHVYGKKLLSSVCGITSTAGLNAFMLAYKCCRLPLTVRHILVDCSNLQDTRLKFFTVSSLKDLFEHVNNRNILNFIEESHFYKQL